MIPSYPKTPHWPKSLSVHRDDHYHHDPSFFVGKPVLITEKMDGGITQIAENRVYARSSNEPTHQPWFSYVKSVTLPKFYNIPPHLLVIGEDLYGVHSIHYDALPDTFFLFGVLDREIGNINSDRTENDRFWSWNAVLNLAQQFGLNTVPVLFEGEFQSTDEITTWFFSHIENKSAYGPVCEGFVMRTADGFAFKDFGTRVCKFVRANHVQTDERWERNWQPAKLIRE